MPDHDRLVEQLSAAGFTETAAQAEFSAGYDAGQRDTLRMVRSVLDAIDADLRPRIETVTPTGGFL